MDNKKLAASAVAVVLALGAGGAAYAVGQGEKVTGPDAEKAKSAALRAVGGGTVTEVERSDGDGAFEVEVERSDGSQVEVRLDRTLDVVAKAAGDDGPNDDEGPNED
ncbi:MAG TPA: PepSY domain-containing protein [Rubrobacter sp.]|nr:PepSY domain-containing protein [Rubrobacter sp.]